MAGTPRSEEMQELIRRIAAHPRGLAFLHVGDLESVAVNLGGHPFAIVEARSELATPEGRARLIEAVRQARSELESSLPALPPAPTPAAPAAPRNARELIRAAQHHPFGPSFLIDGHPECVAVTFHVHPNLVFRARDILSRRQRMSSARPGR